MKSFVLCLLMVLHGTAKAQSISLRLGHAFNPADHISLRYEHWTNGAVNISLGGFYERSRKSMLNYSGYGIELLGEYATNREGYAAGTFGLRYGLGVTAMVDNEPWVYKDWSFTKRLNYGLFGEITGEWFMTDDFTLRSCLQQKALFKGDLGHYRFLASLGLAWRLNTY